MTAIIMKKGGRVEWAFTLEKAKELNEQGFTFVSYVRYDLRRVAYILRGGEVKIEAMAA